MANKDILRYKDSTGVLKTPISKLTAGAGIVLTRKKDGLQNTYDDDEVIITATGSGTGSTIDLIETAREIEIIDSVNSITSVPEKTFRLDNKLKLRDETITFGGCYTGDISTTLTSMDNFTLFFHKITV